MKVSAEDSDRSVKRYPTTQQNPQQPSETESSQVDIPSTTATQVRVKSCFSKKIRSMSFLGNFPIWLVSCWVQLSLGGLSLLLCSLTNWNLPLAHSAAHHYSDWSPPSSSTNITTRWSFWCWWWWSVSIGARDRIPVNLCGSKPRPSVIFPLHVYKYIQIRIKDIQPVSQTKKCVADTFPSCTHWLAILVVSNLIGPDLIVANTCTELSGWSQIFSSH